MNKQDRLAQVRRMAQDDHDAVTMLLAACADMGNSDGLLLSVKAFDKAAEFILDYLRAETAVPEVEAAPLSQFEIDFRTVINNIFQERKRQNAKWGEQNHDDYRWLAILTEEVGELAQAVLHDEFGGKAAGTAETELLHVAAVSAQWLEHFQRRKRETAVPPPAKNALIARCRHCGRAVYASVEVVEHIDDEGPELLELLTAGFDLVYTDVETARGLFGCECETAKEAK